MHTDNPQPQSAPAGLRIGVAGWSYPDWRGPVYGAETSAAGGGPSRSRGSRELERIAGLFDCVEINNTFYRFPEPRLAEGWLRSVASRESFRFTAKAPRELTHERNLDDGAVAAGGKRLLEGLRPLLEAGRLEALLAQLPPWEADGAAARRRIRALVDAVRPVPVSVEVRHASFLSSGDGFLQFLEGIGAGFVNVDLPPGGSHPPPTTINTSAIGYVRLHGRNRTAWFDPRAGRDEKYSYLYPEGELREWAARLRTLSARTPATIAIANNHFKGQAAANALQLLALLGLEMPEIPEGLIELYPVLRGLSPPGRAPAAGAVRA